MLLQTRRGIFLMSTEADIFNSIEVKVSDFVEENNYLLIHMCKIKQTFNLPCINTNNIPT